MNTAEPAADFTWSDAFLLGHAPLDEVHEEFVERVGAMRRDIGALRAPVDGRSAPLGR